MNSSDLKEVLEKILEKYQEIGSLKTQSSNVIILETNRAIGKILATTEKKLSQLERRSGSWMQEISKSLEKHLEKGFSERTLFYCRRFYDVYKNEELDSNLNWSHYRILCTIENPKLRSKLENEVSRGSWKREDLQKRLHELNVIKKRITRGNKWKRPEGELWHYKIKEFTKDENPLLDLGFYSYYEIPKQQSKLYKVGDTIKVKKSREGWVLEKTDLIIKPRNLYFYYGELERVIDGDTILVKLNLGFSVITRQRIRLRNVWSAELDTEAGDSNFEILKRKIPPKTKLVVRSNSKDLYGRYVGDILYSKSKIMSPEEIVRTGNYLNEELSRLNEDSK